MTSNSGRVVLTADSDLARRIEAGDLTIEVESGDRAYRLHVEVLPTSREKERTLESRAGIRAAAGGWRGLVDAEAFKRYVAKRRRRRPRPSVRL